MWMEREGKFLDVEKPKKVDRVEVFVCWEYVGRKI